MNSLDILRKCVLMSGGEEFWVESQKADILGKALAEGAAPKFLEFEGCLFSADKIAGIFTPEKMEERSKLKRGLWKCPQGKWHGRFEFQENGGKCDCSETLGNEVLKAGSFEEWAEQARIQQKSRVAEIDKSMAPLLEKRASIEKCLEQVREALNSFKTKEQVDIWKREHPNKDFNQLKVALESQMDRVENSLSDVNLELSKWQEEKKWESTEYFSGVSEYLLGEQDTTYPMTQQQISDFKDFLDKQVW